MKDNFAEYCKMFGSMIMIILILLVMALSFSGCTKTIYVPAESVRVSTDSAYKAVYVDRLTVERDTVNTYMQGDTVVKSVIKWRIRNVETYDTVCKVKTDSVYIEKPYPVEVIREVEKKLKWWQTTLMWTGIVSLLGICIAAWRLVRKRK